MQHLNLHLHKKKLQEVFCQHDKRDFTIDCILEATMCNVYANKQTCPTIFLIKNGSFCILGGDSSHIDFEKIFSLIPNRATIISSPAEWISKLNKLENITLQQYERYSLNHEQISIGKLNEIIRSKPNQFIIKKIDAELAFQISRDQNFNYHFQNFKSESDFLNIGIGYVAISNGLIVGVASSALVCSKGYEISIMVLPDFRGEKIGKTLSATLVKSILLLKKIPHWDAANETSLNLAKQLGYEFKEKYTAYRAEKN